PVADARSAGDDAHATRFVKMTDRKSSFIEKRLARRVDGHIYHRTHAKSEQDSFLYPAVDAPAAARRGIRFRGPDFAAVQRVLEIMEQSKMLVKICRRLFIEQLLDLSLQRARSGRPAGPRHPALSRSSSCSRASERPSAGAKPAPTVPSSPW